MSIPPMFRILLLVAAGQCQHERDRIISTRVTGQMCLRLVYWTTKRTTQAMLLDV